MAKPSGENPNRGQSKEHTWAQIDPATGVAVPGTEQTGTQAQFKQRDKSQNYVKIDPATGAPLPEDETDDQTDSTDEPSEPSEPSEPA